MLKSIEIMLGSPPERDELAAQLFHTDGGQWGEIYRAEGVYKLDVFTLPGVALQLDCEECVTAIQLALAALKQRLGK